MPHEWNNILVVTKDELVPEFFPSWEALRKKLARDEKKAFGLRRARQGKGRGNEVLIVFDSLPEEWQGQLGDHAGRTARWKSISGRMPRR